jgi:hypothetical protein
MVLFNFMGAISRTRAHGQRWPVGLVDRLPDQRGRRGIDHPHDRLQTRRTSASTRLVRRLRVIIPQRRGGPKIAIVGARQRTEGSPLISGQLLHVAFRSSLVARAQCDRKKARGSLHFRITKRCQDLRS